MQIDITEVVEDSTPRILRRLILWKCN